MRYPLILGQGNFGLQDEDPSAAIRYMEAKLVTIADELLRDIEKDTIDFKQNYDNQAEEPIVVRPLASASAARKEREAKINNLDPPRGFINSLDVLDKVDKE